MGQHGFFKRRLVYINSRKKKPDNGVEHRQNMRLSGTADNNMAFLNTVVVTPSKKQRIALALDATRNQRFAILEDENIDVRIIING